MKTLYVPIGIPGSGKSTYGKQLAKENKNLRIVCPDDIRAELYGDASIQGDGKKVFSIAYSRATEYLKSGKDVYFDATNVTALSRSRLLKALYPLFNSSIAVYFDVPLEVCKKRNSERPRVVPESVLDRMSKKLQEPSVLKERFTTIERM